MNILVGPGGSVHCVYGEGIELSALGDLHIRRASSIEPDDAGHWWADLAPVSGPRLGPFARGSDGLAAESAWLERHWLESAGR